MIYVSSTCIKARTIKESVTALAQAGFCNIELSGGTKYYPDYEKDLLELQDKYALNYQVHNYFPPPSLKPFVLNLATLNDDLYQQSIEHCKTAIMACKKFGSQKYGVHAGFLIDFHADEVGRKIGYRFLNNREKSLERLIKAWDILAEEANDEIDLYFENNVLSLTNAKTYAGENPFLLTDFEGYLEIKEKINFEILLDLAHLKVSANTLGLDFNEEAEKLMLLTDYIHASGNDGQHDQNLSLGGDNDILGILRRTELSNKTIVLEVYGRMSHIIESFDLVKSISE